VKLGRVAIDGTKIKANASKHKAMSYGRMREKDAALTREVESLLRQAVAADRDEDRRYGSERRGGELPAELARRETRLTVLRDAQAALEAQARRGGGRGEGPRRRAPFGQGPTQLWQMAPTEAMTIVESDCRSRDRYTADAAINISVLTRTDS
jgi:hypothetical protein